MFDKVIEVICRLLGLAAANVEESENEDESMNEEIVAASPSHAPMSIHRLIAERGGTWGKRNDDMGKTLRNASRMRQEMRRRAISKAAEPRKQEGDTSYPASSYLVVEDAGQVSTWHLRVLDENGKPDRRQMGAAWAALHGGYRGNKYEGPQKQSAIDKLKKLYRDVGAATPTTKSSDSTVGTLSCHKTADGYRWIVISSSAYQDRDGEWVSAKALAEYVERANATGQYGPLRFWHVNGADFGMTDGAMMIDEFLVETGTFYKEEYAQALQRNGPLQVSIGFGFRPKDRDANGVFHSIEIVERSVVPLNRASNIFTTFTLA